MKFIQGNNSLYVTNRLKPSLFKKFFSYLIILSLTFNPIVVYASPAKQTKDDAYIAAISRLVEAMEHIAQLRGHIDRSQFDIDALLDKLNFDADEIIRFVTKDIYFEQYRGLLRGEQGTLMSGAGNALDQAVLLSSLLKNAGYEVWIKKSKLDDQQATNLIGQLSVVKPPVPSPFENNNAAKEAFRQMIKIFKIPEKKLESFVESAFKKIDIKVTSLYQDAENDAKFIHSILKANGKTIKEREVTNELLLEAKEYYWVEYRLGPTDPIKLVHPAFGKLGKKLEGLKVIETYKDEVPKNLQHRFRFQVFIEQKKGKKLNVTPLMKAWEGSVSNLIGKQLLFSNQPNGMRKLGDLKDPGKIGKKTKFFIPTFIIGDSAVAEIYPFNLRGVILDKKVIDKKPVEELTSHLKNSMDKQSSMFDGLNSSIGGSKRAKKPGKTVDNSGLSAQWIEYTLIAPGGNEKRIKRYTIDRIGAENRQTGKPKINRFLSNEETVWKLAEASQFAISASHYPEAYIFDRYLQRMLKARDALELSIKMSYSQKDKVSFTPEQLAGLNDYPALWLTAGIDTDIPLAKGEKNYQAEPFLLMVKNGITYRKEKTERQIIVDIANRGQRIIRITKDRIFNTPQTAMLLGTWATRLEEVNIKSTNDSSYIQWNTRKAFQLARKKKIRIQLMTPDKKKELKKISDLPTKSRQAITRDLDQGYMIIIPEKAVAKNSQVGWWRVNPDSGETLGMMSSGLGGASLIEKIYTTAETLRIGQQMAVFGAVMCMIFSRKCNELQCIAVAASGYMITTYGWGHLGVVAGKGLAGSIVGLSGMIHDVVEASPYGPLSGALSDKMCN